MNGDGDGDGGGAPGARAAYAGDFAGLFAVVFLAYTGGAVLAWQSFGSAVGPAFFYPSAGITAAALILTRRALWPAVVVAISLGEALVDLYFGNPAGVAVGYATANVVEPLIGASVTLAWCGGTPDLRRRRHLVAFLVGACVLAPIAGGLIGGTTTSLYDGSGWLPNVLRWWAGDGIGVLVTATPILLWVKQYSVVRRRPAELGIVLVLAGLLSVAGFWSQAQPLMLILPILAWAALRLDMLGAALAGAVVAFVATTMTSHGRGVFSEMGLSPASQLAVTQLFVGILVIVSLLVAQEAGARLQALREREAERRERLRLESLSRLAQQLSAALSPGDIGRALERHILNEAGATALSLGLLSRDGRRLEWVVMSGYPTALVDRFGGGVALTEQSLATDTVRTGQPLMVHTPADYAQRYPATAKWLTLTGAQTLGCWPLTAGGKPIGILQLMWSKPQPLNTAQRAYVSAVATMVGQALVRARVYGDEHARAAALQSAVLPAVPADVGGLEVCVHYEPADATQGVGGDWYDVLRMPDDRIYLAIGDVLGYGLPAVEDMAQLRSAARALAHQGLPPARMLAELSGFTRNASAGRFATMSVAFFDPRTGTLRYGSAGHPPAFLRRADTGEVTALTGAGGPALGPIPDASYVEATESIRPGDILVLYTDGLVERRGRDIDTGMAEARRMIGGWMAGVGLAQQCAVLHRTLAPRPRQDDVCSVAVRFTPGTAAAGNG